MIFWNSGEVLVILIYFQQNLMKKITDNFKKNWVKFKIRKNWSHLNSPTNPVQEKFRGNSSKLKKDPFKFKNIFKEMRMTKISKKKWKRKKTEKSFQFFQVVRVIWGKNFWIFYFWRGSASYLQFHILRRFITKYFLFFGAVRVLFTFHFFSWTTPYLIFFLCSSITQYLLRNFIHFFFHNSIVTKR